MSLPDLRSLLRPPASTEASWAELTCSLATVLAVLEEDEFLVVSAKLRAGFVQFAAQGAHGMEVEALGNYHLGPEWKLADDQLARLGELGWASPTADEPSPEWIESDPDFRANFYLELGAPVPFDRLAELAVSTLRGVYRIHHPRMLWYEAFGRGNIIKLPTLGLRMRPPRPAA